MTGFFSTIGGAATGALKKGAGIAKGATKLGAIAVGGALGVPFSQEFLTSAKAGIMKDVGLGGAAKSASTGMGKISGSPLAKGGTQVSAASRFTETSTSIAPSYTGKPGTTPARSPIHTDKMTVSTKAPAGKKEPGMLEKYAKQALGGDKDKKKKKEKQEVPKVEPGFHPFLSGGGPAAPSITPSSASTPSASGGPTMVKATGKKSRL